MRVLLVLASLSLAACSGEINEHLPQSWEGESTTSAAAGSVRFDAIQADIDTLTCSTTGCHGDGQGNFRLVKNAKDADLTANYDAVKARAQNGELSKLIIKATGGEGHVGGTRIIRNDAVYTRWVTWIREGALR
jgi:hypothetical protein